MPSTPITPPHSVLSRSSTRALCDRPRLAATSRITSSPYGRTLRAMRDNDLVADSLGKNLRSLRTSSLVIGGAIAGLSGGLLVGFINLWDPQAWGYAETIVLFAAVIIGGLGNHRGAVLAHHGHHPPHDPDARRSRAAPTAGEPRSGASSRRATLSGLLRDLDNVPLSVRERLSLNYAGDGEAWVTGGTAGTAVRT